jgi:hypothetical protein
MEVSDAQILYDHFLSWRLDITDIEICRLLAFFLPTIYHMEFDVAAYTFSRMVSAETTVES